MLRFAALLLALLLPLGSASASMPRSAKHEPPPIVINQVELDALARVAYCEARGEGTLGMRAVAHVALNRVDDGRWRDDLVGVLSQRAQFTCWTMLDRIRYQGDAWDTAQREALLALLGRSADPTGGATHYHADYVNPRWNRRLPRLATIGRHIFYA